MSDVPAQSKAVRRNRDTVARKERAAALLAGGMSAGEVASTLGVRAEQVSRWRADPDFAAAEDAARTKAVADTAEILRAHGLEGLRGIAQIARDEDNPASLRLDAFKALVSAGLPKPTASVDVTTGGRALGGQMTQEQNVALVRESISMAMAQKGKAA